MPANRWRIRRADRLRVGGSEACQWGTEGRHTAAEQCLDLLQRLRSRRTAMAPHAPPARRRQSGLCAAAAPQMLELHMPLPISAALHTRAGLQVVDGNSLVDVIRLRAELLPLQDRKTAAGWVLSYRCISHRLHVIGHV